MIRFLPLTGVEIWLQYIEPKTNFSQLFPTRNCCSSLIVLPPSSRAPDARPQKWVYSSVFLKARVSDPDTSTPWAGSSFGNTLPCLTPAWASRLLEISMPNASIVEVWSTSHSRVIPCLKVRIFRVTLLLALLSATWESFWHWRLAVQVTNPRSRLKERRSMVAPVNTCLKMPLPMRTVKEGSALLVVGWNM